MSQEPSQEPIERWTAKRRATLVLSILKGDTSVAEAGRRRGLTVAEIEDWRDRFLVGAENALRSRPKEDEALKDEQIKKLRRVRATVAGVSERGGCRILGVARSICQTRALLDRSETHTG